MKKREQVHIQAKLRAAYAFALRTPELLADPERVKAVHDELSGVVHPIGTEQRALTKLVSEGE